MRYRISITRPEYEPLKEQTYKVITTRVFSDKWEALTFYEILNDFFTPLGFNIKYEKEQLDN